MSGGWPERDSAVRHPFASNDNTMKTPGNQRIAVTGSAQTFALPEAARGKFLWFKPVGVAVQFAPSDAARTLVLNQVSNAAAGTASNQAGVTLADGEVFDKVLPNGSTHLCWIGTVATGFIEFYVSEVTGAG